MTSKPSDGPAAPKPRPRTRWRLLSGLHRRETLIDRLLLAQVLGPPRCRLLASRRERRHRVTR